VNQRELMDSTQDRLTCGTRLQAKRPGSRQSERTAEQI
jgi:hypothetical protein